MKNTHDEMIEVIKEHKEGKEIEFTALGRYYGDWQDVIGEPSWNFGDFKYRVKPKEIEAWGVVKDGELIYSSYHKGDAEISVSLENGKLIR